MSLYLSLLTSGRALISGMRNNGGAPCHRCLVKKSNLLHLGAPTDTERTRERRNATQEQSDVLEAERMIQNGYAVNSDKVEDVLKWQSLVPRKVSEHNPHPILLPDIPHPSVLDRLFDRAS